MQLLIDGVPSAPLPSEVADVITAVATVSDELRGHGRTIVSVSVDGFDVWPEHLRGPIGTKSLGEVTTIMVVSRPIRALVEECLGDLGLAAPDLPQICRDLATVFQSDQPSDGFEPFHRLAEIWGHMKSQEMLCLSALALKPEELSIDGVSFVRHTEELNQFLREAAQALEKNDLVLLGDLLEYELAPRAETEPKILALLQQHAGSLASAQ